RGIVRQLERCPEPWCVYPYRQYGGGLLTRSLGCTRFRKEITLDIADVPSLKHLIRGVVLPGQMPDEPPTQCDWTEIDMKLSWSLEALGYTRHLHKQVKHLKLG